jgi:hypothetical protein
MACVAQSLSPPGMLRSSTGAPSMFRISTLGGRAALPAALQRLFPVTSCSSQLERTSGRGPSLCEGPYEERTIVSAAPMGRESP